MTHFLLVYDRALGRLIERRSFPEDRAAEALQVRFELDRSYQDRPSFEVVLIGSDSEQALKRTHASYFFTPEQLIHQFRHGGASTGEGKDTPS